MARQVEHMVYEEKLRKNVGGFPWLVRLVFSLSLKKIKGRTYCYCLIGMGWMKGRWTQSQTLLCGAW